MKKTYIWNKEYTSKEEERSIMSQNDENRTQKQNNTAGVGISLSPSLSLSNATEKASTLKIHFAFVTGLDFCLSVHTLALQYT